MKTFKMTWALVLAGGDGTRLASLTRDEHGNQVPKQFCSLAGGPALMHAAVLRARYVAPRERTCVIVAEKHQRYWKRQLWTLGVNNVIVEPRKRGTANGILLATLHIVKRDPLARIVVLPADHYVRDEECLGASLREAVAMLTQGHHGVVLLGIEPEGVDSDLGHIVPGALGEDWAWSVARFVEKPDLSLAQELLASGAVWNSFIFVADGATLIDLLRQRMPRVVDDMSSALRSDPAEIALRNLYEILPSIDFSRAVLQGAESSLRLRTVPVCGWSDLGTPKQVARALRALVRSRVRARRRSSTTVPGFLNLAEQCKGLEGSA